MEKTLIEIHRELGIGETHLANNRLPAHAQPPLETLRIIDIDFEGKPFVLTEPAAKAWLAMRAQAEREGLTLLPFSGFRSYLHQRQLIARHLRNGRALEEILTNIAIPGFSEHHSGNAIDIHAPGQPILEEDFEDTPEFKWLAQSAAGYGFQLSYPRDNPHGIIYEPWHWKFGM